MAGAERIAASVITATPARAQQSPMRNFRPAFEDIMLTGGADRAAVPQKLASALGSLMESARGKGVEAQVDGILRMYASEIKNDIVLLTISRLRDLVESLPAERLGSRLAQIPHLMREFPQAADTVPEIVMNAERMQGGSRLGLEPMRKMMRSVVGRSKSLCPKELFSVMKSDYESGKFDSIAGVAEARAAVADSPGHCAAREGEVPANPLEPAPASAAPGAAGGSAWPPEASQPFAFSANPESKEPPDSIFRRPEMVWCDEVKAGKRKNDEPGPVFESIASILSGERAGAAPEKRKEPRAERAPEARQPPLRIIEVRTLRIADPLPRSARSGDAPFVPPRMKPAEPAKKAAEAAPEGRAAKEIAPEPRKAEPSERARPRARKPRAVVDTRMKKEAPARAAMPMKRTRPAAARSVAKIPAPKKRKAAPEHPQVASGKLGKGRMKAREAGKAKAMKARPSPQRRERGAPSAREAEAKKKGPPKAAAEKGAAPARRIAKAKRKVEAAEKKAAVRKKAAPPARAVVKRAPRIRGDCSLIAEKAQPRRERPQRARGEKRPQLSIAAVRWGRRAIVEWRNSF